jgi:membrane protein YdbS with pleckstrin-like domain
MNEFELQPGETITRSVRRHWIILVGVLLPYVFLTLLPLIIPFMVHLLVIASPVAATRLNDLISANFRWVLLALSVWWLMLWMAALNSYTKYHLTLWIITTTRIVDIHQYGFFSREVSSFLIDRVQDVTTDVDGFLATTFGFGRLNIETAGREDKFQMWGIKDPVELRDLIMQEIAAIHANGAHLPTGV